MADESRSERFRGNVLECALEFVSDDTGLGILGCIAAAFIVAGIIWAASRLWESLIG
ncbi:MAG: hypothetical protein WA672_10555 [Candidatus Angelobacter sp.]